ncbi:hypothetical protein [Salinicola salarius]|uniref:hypothetical protein n=1 Tax=Salinicola salarius TaxID=430457 RepID=UPI000DA1A5A6|nr:hypothetical protein [Salinicola salarius]
MPEAIHKTDDVFGISRDLPLNYKERDTADGLLVDSLSRDRHLVIYGSSKQGKTSLRKHCLNPDDYITVHCSNKWQLGDIHSAILKKCGFEVTLSNTKSSSGKHKIFASITAGIFGSNATGGAEAERAEGRERETQPLELESEDVNDIISALEGIGFSKFIVLEDFHYLPVETQRDFSVALKAFHENSKICFIVIGVWLEENRLSVYNGDLTGRVLSIDADKWESDELKCVVEDGAALLNVEFSEQFLADLLDSCFKSVHVVQEACHRCCIASGVLETKTEAVVVGEGLDAREIVREVVNQQSGRFNSFITQFADGFQATELEMHRWLLHPVLTSSPDDLGKGLRQKDIRDHLRQHHPRADSLNQGNVTQALQSAAALQIKKDIKPMVLDYDQTNLRLNVVDRSFLIWLDNQDRDELLAIAGLD